MGKRQILGTLATLLVVAAGLAKAQSAPAPGDTASASRPPVVVSDDQKTPVTVRAEFTAPSAGKPGYLFVTAAIEPGWHIYSITQPEGGPTKSEILVNRITPPQGARIVGEFQPSVVPDAKFDKEVFNMTVETHHGTVTWYAPIELAPRADPAKLKIDGRIKVLACANTCQPLDLPFAAVLGPGVPLPKQPQATTPPPRAAERQPLVPPKEPVGSQQATVIFNPDALQIAENDKIKQISLGLAMLMGFVGGLILNLMPCVLPVIGLKILSFLEQAGHNRRRALALNVWYSIGLLSVFLVLATLAVTLGLGWGQLFSYNAFNISMAAVVFVMALSFLGVWEVPIPGLVGRGRTVELAEQEGGAGAFAKGVLTTILATPCSAPLLAPALTWAVGQPPTRTYAIFGAVGLGMASPYLLIGAFPQLIGFLPKPGAWMDTFKQVMGFVLLGTVVFLLTFIPYPLLVPTIGFLFGLWAACWWAGRTPLTADAGVRRRAWLVAVAIGGVAWLVAFGWPKTDELPWRPFTQRALEEAATAGTPVLVDFTADWCLTCKTLEATVLNTRRVRDVVRANHILPLRADWTHGDAEVTTMLELLGSKQVPVLAIFPAGNPNHPIVLRGGYTQKTLLGALEKAGSSK